MLRDLHMTFDRLPPTSNKIYIMGTKLRTESRQYAEWFAAEARKYMHLFSQMNEQGVFALHLRFYMNLVNASWNDLTIPQSRRAKDRYKRIDLSNRVKLIEDCVRDAISIDDSHTFAASQEKHHEPDESKQRVEVFVQEVDPSLFGL
jgi:Holliday junction resolvase RusA-like endonuclease